MSSGRKPPMSGRLFNPPPGRRRNGREESEAISTDTPVKPRLIDRVLLISVVLLNFGDWLLNHGRAGNSDGSGSGLSNGLWALIFLLAFAGVWAERNRAAELLRASRPLVVILVLTLLSALWSDQHTVTARRSIELLGSSAIGLYFVCRLGLRAFVESLAVAVSVSAAASLLLLILFPGVASPTDGELAGFFSHKNRLGPAMVVGMLSIVCLTDHARGTRRFLQFVALFAFLLLLVGSKNGAGIGMSAVFAVFIPFLFWSRARRLSKMGFWGAAVFSAAIVAVLAFALGLDEIFGVIGKDATLTGRTDVWQLVGDAISQRPILGYGYASFWSGDDAPATRLVYPYIYWQPGMAHNGFLEVALNIGLAGEACLIVLLFVAFRKAAAMFWASRGSLNAWPLLFMSYLVISNISDATLLRFSEIDWMLFVAAFFFATKEYQDAKPPQRRKPGFQRVFAAAPIRP